MTSHLYDMRHHTWALAPLIIGVALQLIGVHGAFVFGLMGTVIGISISCAVMKYEMGGLLAAMIDFAAVLSFIVCGGILGAYIGSPGSKPHFERPEGHPRPHESSKKP